MKKLIAIILSITLLFSFAALPVCAELGDSDASININEAKSIFERIGDVFHDLIAKLFKVFGADCPLCENHDGYGEAEGDGDFNVAEVAKMYSDAVNNLKSNNKKLNIEHIRTVKQLKIDGVSLSIKETLDNLLEENEVLGRNSLTYHIERNESAKISSIIPPKGQKADLNGEYILGISCGVEGDYTEIKGKIQDTSSHFDGAATTAPAGFGGAIDYFKLEDVNLGIGEITSADISYKDVTVEAKLDRNSKIQSMKTAYEITVNATVKNSGKTYHLEMKFNCSDEFVVDYNAK